MDDLIYCQRDIPRSKWRYGLRSSAATGCGWIATYNALRLLGYRAEPEALIRYYERQLPLIHGNTGTSFWGPSLFFRQKGFRVRMTARRRRLDSLAETSDVCILFYLWRRGWKIGAHFVALRHTPTGFVGYNTYRNSNGPDSWGPSIAGFLRQRRYFFPILTAIQTKP